jgi:hypothetical protein|tara:strand:+ start:63631 stop:63903 length:273 start_codon:yes stop_codon:yes gene_type:complete
MEFLEDLEMYEEAMENAYQIITRKKTLDDIYYSLEDEEFDEFFLPFDPILEDGRSADIIDMVVEYYTNTEEYEKCAELVKIKEQCKIQTE